VSLRGVVSSGLERTRFGARCLTEGGAPDLGIDPLLVEIDRGAWAGRAIEEVEREEPGAWTRWQAAPSSQRPPGGESLRDVLDRVLPRLDHWAREGDGAAVAIVTHLWVVRVALCAVLRIPLDRATQLDVPTGGIVALDWPSERPIAPLAAASDGPAAGGEVVPHPRPTLVAFAADELPPDDRSRFTPR
jgi:alpha-ribazole phosphatase/probable phosphoglycerate mutase